MFNKVKKFAGLEIKQIQGGKNPLKVVDDFITKLGFEPSKCLSEKNPDVNRWVVKVNDDIDLEILVEGLSKSSEATIYLGIKVVAVPIRGAYDVLAAALEIADGLVGIKVSLVDHFLILSATLALADVKAEELEYYYKLIEAQIPWFKDSLLDELDIEAL